MTGVINRAFTQTPHSVLSQTVFWHLVRKVKDLFIITSASAPHTSRHVPIEISDTTIIKALAQMCGHLTFNRLKGIKLKWTLEPVPFTKSLCKLWLWWSLFTFTYCFFPLSPHCNYLFGKDLQIKADGFIAFPLPGLLSQLVSFHFSHLPLIPLIKAEK